MHHSLKRKILDLDHIESIVEQDITVVEAEKIVGGTLSVSASLVLEKIVKGKPSGSVKPSLLAKPNHNSVKTFSFIITINTTASCQSPMADPLCASL